MRVLSQSLRCEVLSKSNFLFIEYSFQTVRTINPDPADDQAICKPYIESHMLALIDSVLFPTDHTSEKAPSSQIAFTVCFCWGKLLSWSWVTWADQRIVSAEIICFMVSISNAKLLHVFSSILRLSSGLILSNAMQLARNTENVFSRLIIYQKTCLQASPCSL